MAQYDGSITLSTNVDTSGVKKGASTIKSALGGLSGTLTKFGAMLGVAFSVSQLVKFGKEAVSLASDIEEVQNVVDVAFGDMSYKMEEFADKAIETYGISKLTAKKTGSTYMAMAKGMGIAADTASDMALNLTALSADMSSFYNVSQEMADIALKSVFTGETETLKQYGIVMTQVNLQEFARQQGITKSIQKMTQQEQVMLRYKYILQQTSLAQGDFARTSDSWANQTRMLSERWKEMQAEFGEAFKTIATLVLPSVNSLIKGLTHVAQIAKVAAQNIAMLFGRKINTQSDTAAKNYETLADSTGSASENMEGVADATKDANKEAKKALASFDELNILSSDLDGNTAGLNIENTQVNGNEYMDIDTTIFDEVKDKLSEIKDIFMSGFWEGFASADFEELKGNINGIKNSVLGIVLDPAVQSAASNFAENFTRALGQIVGSVASIGITIANNLLGGIEYYLSQNKERIKTQIIDIFNISSEICVIVGNWWTAIANIFSVFAGKNAQKLTGDIIGIFADVSIGLQKLGLRLGRDFIDIFAGAIIDNQDAIKTALDGILEFFSNVAEDIHSVVQDLFDGLINMYDRHIKPLMETMKETWSEWTRHLVDSWNLYIKPVLDNIANKFHEVVEEHVKPMIDKIMEFLGKWADALKELWDNVLRPFGSWLIDELVPIFANGLKTVGDVFNTLLATASDVIGGIFGVLGGLIDFISGVFSGDWEKAWNGIKDILKGIFNILVSIVEGAINLIISALNTPIRGMNSILDDVGDALGIRLSIPQIRDVRLPRLATGAVLKPNNPFLAVVGDQKRGTNIEAPLDTIKQAVAEVITEGTIPAIEDLCTNLMQSISQAGQMIVSMFTNLFMKANEITSNQINTIAVIQSCFAAVTERLAVDNETGSASYGIFETILHECFSELYKFFSAQFERIEEHFQHTIERLFIVESTLNMINNSVTSLGLGLSSGFGLRIPALAQGSVIPPNRPFLAALGDQKSGTNVEAPLDTIKQAVAEVLGNGNSSNINVNFTGSLSQLARVLNPEITRENQRVGTSLITESGR